MSKINFYNFKSYLILAICLTLIIIADIAEAAAIELTFKVTLLKTNNKNETRTTTSLKKVLILKDYLATRENHLEKIYSFDNFSVLNIDHNQKKIQENSIYSIISARDSALQSLSNFDLDQQYSSESAMNMFINKKVANKFNESIIDDLYSFKFQKFNSSFKIKNFQIPLELINTYSKFIIYEMQIHPYIRNKIVAKKQLVEKTNIEYALNDMSIAINWELLDFQICDESKLKFPEGYIKKYSDNTNLNEIFKQTFKWGGIKTQSYYDRLASQKITEGKLLDAYLVLSESLFQYNEASLEKIYKIFQIADDNSELYKFYNALHEKKLEKIPDSINYLNSFSKSYLASGEIIYVFLGKLYLKLGNIQEALNNFFKALNYNLYLSEVYIEMGKILIKNKKIEDAWACFQAAESIINKQNFDNEVGQIKGHYNKLYHDYIKNYS